MASPYAHKVTKHPNSERTFTLDLTDWLDGLGTSETIDTAEWDEGDFTVIEAGSVDGSGLMSSIQLGGGTVRLQPYPVVCTVTTSSGEVQPFTFLIEVTSP